LIIVVEQLLELLKLALALLSYTRLVSAAQGVIWWLGVDMR
jgi:hypothetical protein